MRIGIIYPSDGVLDREFWSFAPPDTSVHVTRVRFPEAPLTVELARRLADDPDMDQAAEALRPIRPAAVAYACTSVSFALGSAGDRAIIERIARGANAPATSTSSALVAACRALGVRKVALGAPYLPELTARLEHYLEEAGVVPVSSRSLGLDTGIGALQPEDAAGLARHADVPDAEAVLLACTNLASHAAIERIERALDKPVITANQATMWHACRIAGCRSRDGIGRLWRAAVPQSADETATDSTSPAGPRTASA